MSLTTVTVSIVAYEATGGPMPNGIVKLELTDADINGGLILPVPVPPVKLDANGLATVQLWSNSLGTQGTQYRCEFVDADGTMRATKLATIPNTNCNLHECFTNAPPVLSDAQVALNGAQAAQAAAANSATSAAASASSASTSATSAATSATSASGSATAASASASAAATSETNAGNSATAAAGSASSASTSATNAGASATAAAGSATSASDSAALAQALVSSAGIELDGGAPNSNYGGLIAIDGGTP